MSSEFQRKFNNEIRILISNLLKSHLNFHTNDPKFQSYISKIQKYLNDHSLDYISRKTEVEIKINNLIEKLEINSQYEKSKLLLNYIDRLKNIYENKNQDQKDNLYSFLNLIINLSHSPLNTIVNLEIFKENFENRYIQNKYKNKLIQNENEDFEYENNVQIPQVDYNENTPIWSEDSNEENNNNNIENENLNNDLNDENNNFLNQNSNDNSNMDLELKYKENLPYTYQYKNINNNLSKTQFLFDSYSNLFKNSFYYKNMPNNFFIHLLNLNKRLTNEMIKNKKEINNDFILNDIFHLFLCFTNEDKKNCEYLLNNFDNFDTTEISKKLLNNILLELNEIRINLNFLRNLEKIFKEHELKCVIIEKFIFILNEYLNVHDLIINKLQIIFYYQKGKIEKNENKNLLISNKNNFNFLNKIIEKTNFYIKNLLKLKYKFTLIRFLNFYKEILLPILNYFLIISKFILNTEIKLKNLNKFSYYLLNKLLIDTIFNFTKNNKNFQSEIFFYIIETYIKFIFEFIINGNLIDVYDEFFIEHKLRKKNNKKIIFSFNEKFKNFNWIDFFKIKSFNLNEFNFKGACVPIFFMKNNLHFKILETGKTTFLLKNLNVVNYFDDLNLDLLLNDENENFFEENKQNFNKKNKNFNNELKLLNEKLFIRREEILNNQLEMKKNFFFNNNNKNFNENEKTKENTFYLDDDENSMQIDFQNNQIIHQNNLNENFEIENNNNPFKKINYEKIIENSSSNEIKNLNEILKEKSNKKIEENFNFDINIILNNLFIKKIKKIKKILNTKFLNILINDLQIEKHFNLLFNLFLFKAGFSMNKFIIELNNFILNSPKNSFSTEKNNFFLQSLLINLTNESQSDLNYYKKEIFENVRISFNEINSLSFHNNEDLINIQYLPILPVNIFFDFNIINLYNLVFNFIVKLKRCFSLIRDIKIDKKIKNLFFQFSNFQFIIKIFISYRLNILYFANNIEFFVFHFVIDFFIKKFENSIQNLNSIDDFLNTHKNFIKNIFNYLGLNDQNFLNKIYDILNMIVNFNIYLTKFIEIDKNDQNEIYKFYINISNESNKFLKEQQNIFNNFIDVYKEKINLIK